MEFRYVFNHQLTTVRVETSGAGYVVIVNGKTFTVDEAQVRRPGELALTLNGARRSAFVAAEGPRRWVALEGRTFVFSLPEAGQRRGRGRSSGHDALEAQMPGVVRRVHVGAGEQVAAGQALVVLEAMKMEIRVGAPHAGVVEKVLVREGQTVERGQVLVELAANPPL
jgi:biotin carboxyl carrier protein